MHSTQIPVGNKSNPQTSAGPSAELFIMLKSCGRACLTWNVLSKPNKSKVPQNLEELHKTISDFTGFPRRGLTLICIQCSYILLQQTETLSILRCCNYCICDLAALDVSHPVDFSVWDQRLCHMQHWYFGFLSQPTKKTWSKISVGLSIWPRMTIISLSMNSLNSRRLQVMCISSSVRIYGTHSAKDHTSHRWNSST